MSLKALLLDVGNTLLYETPSRAAIYAAEAERLGRSVSEGQMGEWMSRAARELPRVWNGHYRYSDPWFEAFIERIFGDYLGVPAGERAETAPRLFARFEDPNTFQLFPGAHDLLRAARRARLRVGVVSNWSARLPRLLDGLGLSEGLDFIVCSAIERTEKPERRIFELALSHAQVEPFEALHAGDHPVRDGAALNLGLQAVLVDHYGVLRGANLPRVDDLAALWSYVEERLP